MLYVINLMFLTIRAHQTMTEEERRQHNSMTKKGNAKTNFLKIIRRHVSKERR